MDVDALIEQAAKEQWTYLSLRGEALRELPESIGQLSSLTTLSLSNNQLRELPRSIGQLSNLTGLSLRNNQLSGRNFFLESKIEGFKFFWTI